MEGDGHGHTIKQTTAKSVVTPFKVKMEKEPESRTPVKINVEKEIASKTPVKINGLTGPAVSCASPVKANTPATIVPLTTSTPLRHILPAPVTSSSYTALMVPIILLDKRQVSKNWSSPFTTSTPIRLIFSAPAPSFTSSFRQPMVPTIGSTVSSLSNNSIGSVTQSLGTVWSQLSAACSASPMLSTPPKRTSLATMQLAKRMVARNWPTPLEGGRPDSSKVPSKITPVPVEDDRVCYVYVPWAMDEFVPSEPYKGKLLRAQCKGRSSYFQANYYQGFVNYINHCIKQCPEYGSRD